MRLDIGCGENKIKGFTGVDKRPLKGVDVVHDIETFPFPFKDNSASIVNASHVIEHIDPKVFIDFMNELWRITERLEIEVPHGLSESYIQDPTHVNPCNKKTFEYFCPDFTLYNIYRPRPWKIEKSEQIGDFIKIILTKYGIQQ